MIRWGLLEGHHTIGVTGIRQLLEERADRPEDEVRSRVCLFRRCLNLLQALGSVLLEDLLIWRSPSCGRHKGDQETRPATHAGLSEGSGRKLEAAELCIFDALAAYQMGPVLGFRPATLRPIRTELPPPL